MTDTTSTDKGDYLGYGVYADTLWDRVKRALDKDGFGAEDLGEDPLVVGLFGEWGAGKSKLLSLIQKRAIKHSKETIEEHLRSNYAPITVPVFFQPWKYEHEKHLLVPILLHILQALSDTLKKAKTLDDKMVGTVHAGIDVAIKSVGGIVQGVKKIAGIVDPSSASALAVAELLTDFLPAQKKPKKAENFHIQGDGRDFYEMHSILKKITRPGKYPEVTGNNFQDKDFGINFVIFIDDLDRCLPEKAVETLELIKTIFNLESFAFVLALDEEVVERGIAHRYKDYSLADKKADMPITGFEYLEKIVHLPFRLPALTRAQAVDFVLRYEEGIEKDENLRWFNVPPRQILDVSKEQKTVQSEKGDFIAGQRVDTPHNPAYRNEHIDLLDLAMNAFDVYVPRKLVRMVELMHQVATVAKERKRSLNWQAGKGGEARAVDVRVVLALLLIQLFQPELYRFIRRKPAGFAAILNAFSATGDGGAVVSIDFESAEIADVDLWAWVAQGSTREAATHKSVQNPAKHTPIFRIQRIEDRVAKATAQQVRLPLVQHLVEFRTAQRHAFDVLKLMKALAGSLDKSNSMRVGIHGYLSLLGKEDPVTITVPATPAVEGQLDNRPRQSVVDIQKLFDDLVKPNIDIAGDNNLKEGYVLDSATAKALLEKAKQQSVDKTKLAAGLTYLAPYLAKDDGKDFWVLIKDAQSLLEDIGKAFAKVEDIAPREAAVDLMATLGADTRFTPDFYYLPAGSSKENPLAGFVKIPAGTFTMGHKDQSDNQPREVNIAEDFYIAPYLTTVDQYACFVDAKGYENEAYWNATGILWRNGTWDSKIKEKAYKEHLASRTKDLRQQPVRWAEQRAHGSRPVWGVSWFEAFAYANWLQAQQGFKGKYKVSLPTEAQWERAARAVDHNTADGRDYPWALAGREDENTAHLHANIGKSGLSGSTVVGIFPPSSIGLYDISGNLWEWQGNLYINEKKPTVFPLLTKQSIIKTAESVDDCDRPALRGGSWDFTADYARTGYRDGYPPVDWNDLIGFRVVLSLA